MGTFSAHTWSLASLPPPLRASAPRLLPTEKALTVVITLLSSSFFPWHLRFPCPPFSTTPISFFPWQFSPSSLQHGSSLRCCVRTFLGRPRNVPSDGLCGGRDVGLRPRYGPISLPSLFPSPPQT